MPKPDVPLGLASENEYIELATRDLSELFGFEMGVDDAAMPPNRIYGRPQPGNEPWIRLPAGQNKRLKMKRSLPLTKDESVLLKSYADALHEFAQVPLFRDE